MGEDDIKVIKRIIFGCRRNMVSFVFAFNLRNRGLWGIVPASKDVVVAVPFIPESLLYLGQNTATVFECAH